MCLEIFFIGPGCWIFVIWFGLKGSLKPGYNVEAKRRRSEGNFDEVYHGSFLGMIDTEACLGMLDHKAHSHNILSIKTGT